MLLTSILAKYTKLFFDIYGMFFMGKHHSRSLENVQIHLILLSLG